MTLREAQERADALAKSALFYVPICAGITALAILFVAAKPSYIAAGWFITVLGMFLVLIPCLLPSYLLEAYRRLTGDYYRELTKSEVVKDVARKHGLPVLDVKLTTMDPKDLRGIPLDS